MSQIIKLDAVYYSKNSSIQKRLASDILKLHSFNLDETILDIGCGDGAISANLALIANKGTVLGIGSSNEIDKYAKKKFAINCKNLNF